jgi:membrane-bound lytic murein transglycosylase B
MAAGRIIGGMLGIAAMAALGWFVLGRSNVAPPPMPAAVQPVAVVVAPPVAPVPPLPPALPPGAEMAFASFLAALATDAQAAGISVATFEAATAGLTPDPQVLELSQSQPEHSKSVSEYVTALVSETRLENGLKNLAANDAVARKIEAAYGVDRHVLIAIWGVESNFGNAQGQRNVIRSLATLAALEPRRPQYLAGA